MQNSTSGRMQTSFDRWTRLLTSFGLMILIGLILAIIIEYVVGGGIFTYVLVLMGWALVLGFSPLLNRFLIIVPENSGAVIGNYFRTYEPVDNPTKLGDTASLREVGPNLQGILPWEYVGKGWIIDLGKTIIIEETLDAPSKEEIKLTVKYQIVLTPLRGYLVNLVRINKEAVEKHFRAFFRGKLLQFIKMERAEEITRKNSQNEDVLTPSIFENRGKLEKKFNKILGGPDKDNPEERKWGTFTGNPQIIDILRSKEFQDAVEARAINQNNAEAIKELTKIGVTKAQAVIAVLSAQDKSTEGLIDINANIKGLKNLRDIYFPGLPTAGRGKTGKQKRKGEKENE